MWATGMMDPNWWKETALNHKWYRDDNAYADFCISSAMFGFAQKYLAVHYNGARGFASIVIPVLPGAAGFSPSDEPFEVQSSEPFVLKDSEGNSIYRISKIVCEKNTLILTMLKISSNEESEVTMGIAPEGFTTDLFEKLLPNLSGINSLETAVPVEAAKPQDDNSSKPESWVCPCGAENIGKYCIQCGHPRG